MINVGKSDLLLPENSTITQILDEPGVSLSLHNLLELMLLVSDNSAADLCIQSAGRTAAVRKEWLGASWQCCKIHFIRNILAKIPHREKARFAERLKQIWLQPDKRSAKRMAMLLREEHEKRFPEASRCLE